MVLLAASTASIATSPNPMLVLEGTVPRVTAAESRPASDFVGPAGPEARACTPDHWTADTYAGGWRAVRVSATVLRPADTAGGGPSWRDVAAWAEALAAGRRRCGQALVERVLLLADADAPVALAAPLPAAFAAAGILDVRWYLAVDAAGSAPTPPPPVLGRSAATWGELLLPGGAHAPATTTLPERWVAPEDPLSVVEVDLSGIGSGPPAGETPAR